MVTHCDRGGLVLCGGQSRRMGSPKYALTLGSETLLQRICRIVCESTPAVVVVAAPGQSMPPLPDQVMVVRDEFPGEGPLAGIVTGLDACRDFPQRSHVFVTACDAPLLQREIVEMLFDRVADHDAIVLQTADRLHPLCGVYRTGIADTARDLFQRGERRPRALLDAVRTRVVAEEEIQQADPRMLSLENANTPDEFRELLTRCSPDGKLT